MLEPDAIDRLAATTKAGELAWAINFHGNPTATAADGVRYILDADGLTLFAVHPGLGGVERCAEPWVKRVLAPVVARHAAPYTPPPPTVRHRRRARAARP